MTSPPVQPLPPLHLRDLDEPAMLRFAEALGGRLRVGDVVLLDGPMGAGKTTWVRALARGLGVDAPDRVCSPTFNVSMEHRGPVPLVHVDLFRLGETMGGEPVGAAAFEALGLDESLDGSRAVIAVEWAELWGDPPAEHLHVQIARGEDATVRSLTVQARGAGAEGLAGRVAEAAQYSVPERLDPPEQRSEP